VKPEGLSLGASVIWDELAPICLYMGTLTSGDVRPFAKLCELEATFMKAVSVKDTPDFDARLERETANALRPYFEYFGMTPSARARLSVPKKADAPQSKWAGIK